MMRFIRTRSGQLQEIALDLGLLATFAIAWHATRSIHEIARWFPDTVTVAGMAIVLLKLVLDGYALTKPVVDDDPDPTAARM